MIANPIAHGVNVASGFAVPVLVISQEVQLAVVAGVFGLCNTGVNALVLIYTNKTKNKVDSLDEKVKETHDIIERRKEPR